LTRGPGRDNHTGEDPVTDTIYSEIDSSKQDANWHAPKLILVGAIALAIALAIIYTAATILGE
jgi:hypothetical protein